MAETKIQYGNHGVVELTDLVATNYGAHILNTKADVDVDNGSVAKVGAYIEPDVFKADIPTVKDEVVLLASTVKIYGEYTKKFQEESNFYNGTGELIRSYQMIKFDRFTLSPEAFDDSAVPAIGEYVGVNGTDYQLTTLGASAPDATTRGFIGYIYNIADNGNYRIVVLQNTTVA